MIAEGTVDDLKARVGGERLELTVTEGGDLEAAARVLASYAIGGASGSAQGEGNVRVETDRRHASATVEGGAKLLARVVRDLDAAGVQLDDLGLRRPTLDDVFLALTGRAAEQPDATQPEGTGQTDGRRDKEVA